MKKYIFLLLFTATAFAQSPLPPGELIVDGYAKASVVPDMITFSLEVKKENKAEAEALKQLNAELDVLQKFLSASGIPVKQVKITDFSVKSATLKKMTDKIFFASASVSVELHLDYKLADAIYAELQSGKYKDVTVRYNTSLSDALDKKTRETLLQEAIADAKQKAESIAKSLSIKITGVKNVSKSGNNDGDHDGVPDYLDANYNGYEMLQTIFTKFEVEDEQVYEYINIVYYIKN